MKGPRSLSALALLSPIFEEVPAQPSSRPSTQPSAAPASGAASQAPTAAAAQAGQQPAQREASAAAQNAPKSPTIMEAVEAESSPQEAQRDLADGTMPAGAPVIGPAMPPELPGQHLPKI